MKYEWLDGHLLGFPGAEKRWHPAWKMFLYEVRGKQFAALCAPEEKYKVYGGHELVNLRCDPRLAEPFRAEYPEILPGFYCDKRSWVAALLDGDLPDQVLRDLCQQSYRLTVARLPKYVQRELQELT